MNVNTHRFYGYLDDEKLFFPSAQLPRCKKLFHLCNNNYTNVYILLHLFAIYFLKIFFFPLLIFVLKPGAQLGFAFLYQFVCYVFYLLSCWIAWKSHSVFPVWTHLFQSMLRLCLLLVRRKDQQGLLGNLFLQDLNKIGHIWGQIGIFPAHNIVVNKGIWVPG